MHLWHEPRSPAGAAVTLDEALRVVGHLLEHHGTRGVLARDAYGKPVNPAENPAACSWCLLGALWVVSSRMGLPFGALKAQAYSRTRYVGLVTVWDFASPTVQRKILRRLQTAGL